MSLSGVNSHCNVLQRVTETSQIGEEYQTVEMDLTAKGNNPFLRQCDVFDTRISTAYISSANSVSYEPFVFTVLKELAVIAARIQHVIQDKIGAIPELQLSRPDFIRKSAEATWLEQLTEKSTIPEECIVWKETDAKRIDELNKLLDTQQVRTSIKNKEYQRNQIKKIYDEVHGISKRIAETVPTAFRVQYEALQKAKPLLLSTIQFLLWIITMKKLRQGELLN